VLGKGFDGPDMREILERAFPLRVLEASSYLFIIYGYSVIYLHNDGDVVFTAIRTSEGLLRPHWPRECKVPPPISLRPYQHYIIKTTV